MLNNKSKIQLEDALKDRGIKYNKNDDKKRLVELVWANRDKRNMN